MVDLEELGFIEKPHTSAGREPSDKGYRYFVDTLMTPADLSPSERTTIIEHAKKAHENIDLALGQTSSILGRFSQQLGVVIAPRLDNAVIDRIKLIELFTGRLLLIFAFKSGIIKTKILEHNESYSYDDLEQTNTLLNERLAGNTIRTIRDTLQKRLQEIPYGHPKLIHAIISTADLLFTFFDDDMIHFQGTEYIANAPELSTTEDLKNLIMLLDKKEILSDVMYSEAEGREMVVVKIGSEISHCEFHPFSIIVKSYHLGNSEGTLGIIGPKRMAYSKNIPLVQYTARVFDEYCSTVSS